MKILLIEDDKSLIDFLSSEIIDVGFGFEVAEDGDTGLLMALNNNPDVIILDLNIPKISGKDVCSELREKNISTPIIILSADKELDNKIDLLNIGADDYITKPFSFEELMARINAVSRRARKPMLLLSHEDIIIDIETGIVKKNDEELFLTLKEYELLCYLLKNKGKIISRGEIIENVWDVNADIFSNSIETHISTLRKKLKDKSNRIIKTVSCRGYRIG